MHANGLRPDRPGLTLNCASESKRSSRIAGIVQEEAVETGIRLRPIWSASAGKVQPFGGTSQNGLLLDYRQA